MGQVDLYWDMASRAVTIVSEAISACLFAQFMTPFLKKRRYAWEAGGVYFFAMLVIYLVPYEFSGMFANMAALLVVFAVICIRDRNDCCGQYSVTCQKSKSWEIRNVEQKVFLVALMDLIEWFTHGITMIFRDILFYTVLFSEEIMNKPSMVYWGYYLVVEMIYVALRFVIMFFLFRLIDHVYIYKRENMDKKELALLLTVLLSVLAGYFAFNYFFQIYSLDDQWHMWNMNLAYNWVKALYQAASFAAILSSIVLYQSMRSSNRREKEEAVLEEQIASMKRHISEVETLYKDIRGIKHDMGNHVMVLESLWQKGSQQEAASYLANLKEEFQEVSSGFRTGNPVTDVILMEKEREARGKGIAFLCNFHYPEGGQVNAFDVSIILTNGVNNAIEGAMTCSRPYIRIESFQKNNAYLIEIKNCYAGRLLFDGETGIPVTTKADKEEHGCGIANIRKVAQKYFGEIEIRQDGEDFVLHVMLMLQYPQ